MDRTQVRRALAVVAAGALFLYGKGYRVKFKNGVLTAFSPELSRTLPIIDAAYRELGGEAEVTSGSEGYSGDGVHSSSSYHYAGDALDLNTTRQPFTSSQKRQLALTIQQRLRAKFGPWYDVIYETSIPGKRVEHIHLEYDRRRYLASL